MRFSRGTPALPSVFVCGWLLALGVLGDGKQSLSDNAISSSSFVLDFGKAPEELLGSNLRRLAAGSGSSASRRSLAGKGKKKTGNGQVAPPAASDSASEAGSGMWLLAEWRLRGEDSLMKYAEAEAHLAKQEALVYSRGEVLEEIARGKDEGGLLGLSEVTSDQREALRKQRDDLVTQFKTTLAEGAVRLLWSDLWVRMALFGIDPAGDGREISEDALTALLEKHVRGAPDAPEADASSVDRAVQILTWFAKRGASLAEYQVLLTQLDVLTKDMENAEAMYASAVAMVKESSERMESLSKREQELANKEQEIKIGSLQTGGTMKVAEKYVTFIELKKLGSMRRGIRTVFEKVDHTNTQLLDLQSRRMATLNEEKSKVSSLKQEIRKLTGAAEYVTWIMGGFPPMTPEEKKVVLFTFFQEAKKVRTIKKNSPWSTIVQLRRKDAMKQMLHLTERAHNLAETMRVMMRG